MKKIYFLVFLVAIICLVSSMGNQEQYPVIVSSLRNKTSDFEPYKFIVFGDTRNSPDGNNEGMEACAGLIEDLMDDYDIEFIMHTGDMVNSGANPNEWSTYYWPEMTSIADEVPIYYAVGNHEYENDVGAHDKELTQYLENIENPGNEIYYSFDSPQGDTHFIVINSEYYDVAEAMDINQTRRDAQEAWLEADFLSNEIDRIVVMMHRPLWGVNEARVLSDYHPLRAVFHDMFVENGVDFVLSGHEHYFYETVRNGTAYMTIGTGTYSLSNPTPNGANVKKELLETDVYFSSLYAVSLVEATEAGFDIDIIADNGSIVHEFSVNVAAADIYAPTITSPADITMNVSTTGNSISWTATDAYPDDYEITQDGSAVADDSWTSGTTITYTLDDLALGTYSFEITVSDASGNSASDTVSVTVQEKPSGGGAPSFELPLALLSLLGVFLFKRWRKR